MTGGQGRGLDRRCPVWILSRSTPLASALAGGLRAMGWEGAHVGLHPPGPGRHSRPGVVLVADEDDRMPVGEPFASEAARVVALARVRSGHALLAALAQGVDLVNADQPFDAQLREVDGTLTADDVPVDRRFAIAAVQHFLRDVERLARLTPREAEVLTMLMRGHSAGRIAHLLVVSTATVRTHIQAILRKLEVPSQLAAAALAWEVDPLQWRPQAESPQI